MGDPRDALMRVPDEMLDCVVFLCVQDQGDAFHYGGTAFLVAIPSEVPPKGPDGYGYGHAYLVTARHNIERAKQTGHLFVRVNVSEGASEYVRVDSGWIYHPNDAVDVAVLPWRAISGNFDVKVFFGRSLVTDQAIRDMGIGVGDELLITGLFTQRKGNKRNLPIVRTGIIAAMPHEPLEDENTGLSYNAYLAEVRSIGGLSGSPVFVLRETQRTDPAKKHYAVLLLGMIRGHWDLKTKQAAVDFAEDELSQVNMGIALVTPSQDILAVIDSEGLMKERKEFEREYRRRNAPTLDSAFKQGRTQTTAKGADIPALTRGRFFADLEKATTRPASSRRGPRKR